MHFRKERIIAVFQTVNVASIIAGKLTGLIFSVMKRNCKTLSIW